MRVLVTGHGLLASAIKECVKGNENYVFPERGLWEFTHKKKTKLVMEAYKPDVVIHTAAKVGGVGLNSRCQEDMYYDNIVINANVIHAAIETGVKRIVAFGSSCTYDERLDKLTEGDIQTGEPFIKNYGYGFAKRMTEVHLRTANMQHGTEYTFFVPVGMYGPNDNFNLQDGHVVPSLIHKCYLAKQNGDPLKVWGDGSPRRELLFAPDMARIIVSTVERDQWFRTVLVSSGEEVTVRNMVEGIAKAMDFTGEIVWESDKPVGQLSRPLADTKKLKTLIKPDAFTPFEEGISQTVDWFVKNFDSARK